MSLLAESDHYYYTYSPPPLLDGFAGSSGQEETFTNKASALAQKVLSIKDAGDRPIWTCRDFDWAYRNPFDTVFKRGNDYVTEQWSEDYIIACKNDVGLFKQSIMNIGRSFGDIKWKDETGWNRAKNVGNAFGYAFLHFLNALIVAGKLAINIELANFLKGVFGAVVSGVKTGIHFVLTLVYLFGAGFTGIGSALGLCRSELSKELAWESLCNFGFMFKDIASIVTCLGHAIPSWLPIVLTFILPPAGLILGAVKIASKFTGIFDVAAYGGTAALLYAKVVAARADKGNPESEKDLASWEKLKKEIHPCKSLEGAALALYALNVLLEGVATAVDVFAPGAGTAAKYAVYGTLGVTAIGLGVANYKHYKEEQALQEATQTEEVPSYIPANQRALL
jgi:hypothetical protein